MKKTIIFIAISLSLFSSDLYVGIGIGSQSNNENNFKSINAFAVDWDFYKKFKKSDVGLGCIIENNLKTNNTPYSVFALYGIYRVIDNSLPSRSFFSFKAGYFPLAITSDLFGLLYSSAGIGYNFRNKYEIELSYRILLGAEFENEDDFRDTDDSNDVPNNSSEDSDFYNSKLLTLTLRKNFH